MTTNEKLRIIYSWTRTFKVVSSSMDSDRLIGRIMMMGKISLVPHYTDFHWTHDDVVEDAYDLIRQDIWEYVYRWVA